eukprot:3632629-Rhodomonas_salina.2
MHASAAALHGSACSRPSRVASISRSARSTHARPARAAQTCRRGLPEQHVHHRSIMQRHVPHPLVVLE